MHASNYQSGKVRGFGRRQPFAQAKSVASAAPSSADAQLFLTSFAAGLIFMTIFLA
jgi:hypothetical protein